MSKELELLAKELANKYWEECEPHPDRYKLARHVQSLLISARIEELAGYIIIDSAAQRVKYLKKQLAAIGETNGER